MSLVHRVLFVAWQNPTTRRISPVGRLVRSAEGSNWEFAYVRGARHAEGFRPFPGLPDFGETYRSSDLPAFLRNRLMPSSRPDRPAFLERLGLRPDLEDEIPILARSEGLKETDTIEVFGLPTFDAVEECYRYFFFVRGIRYVNGAEQRILALRPGDALHLVEQPDNETDPQAILVSEDGRERLGYVPQTLVEDLHGLIGRGTPLAVTVERVNPAPAPVQLRLLCRLEACQTDGFAPFAGERYRPIPADATSVAILPQELVG